MVVKSQISGKHNTKQEERRIKSNFNIKGTGANLMEKVEMIIKIHKITSGKCDFFTFWETSNTRLEPFILKPANSIYTYPHHMRNEDLLMWKKYSNRITSFCPGLKAQAWEDCMKHEIYSIISSGNLNQTVEHKGKMIDLQVIWTGKPVPRAKLEYK